MTKTTGCSPFEPISQHLIDRVNELAEKHDTRNALAWEVYAYMEDIQRMERYTLPEQLAQDAWRTLDEDQSRLCEALCMDIAGIFIHA